MKYYSIFNPENNRKRRNMRKAQIILFRTRIERIVRINFIAKEC